MMATQEVTTHNPEPAPKGSQIVKKGLIQGEKYL